MSVYDIAQIVLNLNSCQVFDCADDAVVQSGLASLADFDKEILPIDFIRFLTDISDGFVFNGICFFGFNEHKLIKSASIPSLYDANLPFSEFNCFKSKIIIGMFFSYLILYNSDENCFELLNNFTFLPIDTYSDFESLFYNLIDKRSD